MRKLKLSQRTWQYFHTRNSVKRKFRRRKREIGLVTGPGWQKSVMLPKPAQTLPNILCLDTNRDETIIHIENLRRRLNSPPMSGIRAIGRRLKSEKTNKGAPRWIAPFVDFRQMTHISAAAALILAAEYDRARRRYEESLGKIGNLYLVDLEKWNENVVSILFNINFFGLLGISEPPPNIDGEISILPFASGNRNNRKDVDELLDAIDGLLRKLEINIGDECFELASALGEAMENVVGRAYPSSGKYAYNPVNRWWMTGAINTKERSMTVAIFDQGVSIPGSLSGWKQYKGFTHRFFATIGRAPDLSDPQYDGDVIKIAIHESASSTGEEKHGKGLNHIKNFIDSCKDGHLLILSRRGSYFYSKGKAEKTEALPCTIGGTLIEWVVKI